MRQAILKKLLALSVLIKGETKVAKVNTIKSRIALTYVGVFELRGHIPKDSSNNHINVTEQSYNAGPKMLSLF